MTVVRLMESGVLDAGADAVWAILRDFSSASKWSEEITGCEMEGGAAPSQVGGIRKMTFSFGPVARERLVALSDRERFFEYELLPPEELPFKGYLGKMQVTPINETDQCVVSWASSFTVTDGDPAEAERQLGGAYRLGLKGLEAFVKSTSA